MQIIQEPVLPYKSRKRRLSLDLKPPVPISSHITKLVLGFYKAMKAFIPYNFVAANSRMPIWNTEEKIQNQGNTTGEGGIKNLLIAANPISL